MSSQTSVGYRAGHVAFIGEVQLGLDHRTRMDEPLSANRHRE